MYSLRHVTPALALHPGALHAAPFYYRTLIGITCHLRQVVYCGVCEACGTWRTSGCAGARDSELLTLATSHGLQVLVLRLLDVHHVARARV